MSEREEVIPGPYVDGRNARRWGWPRELPGEFKDDEARENGWDRGWLNGWDAADAGKDWPDGSRGRQWHITIEDREDGGLRIWSDDIPGLVLSHRDRAAVLEDLGPALKVIMGA